MTGSLQANKGTYYAVLNMKDENGRRKQKAICLHIPVIKGNKRIAEQSLKDVLREYEDKRVEVYSKDILFCDYLQVWLDSKVKIEFNTREAYQCNIDAHIYPFFKKLNVSLQNVEYRHIEAYYAAKGKTLSANTLKKHHAIIKQTLRKAVQSKLIASNPATDIELPKTERFTGSFLSAEQGNILLNAVKDTPMEPVIVLAMMYGLRRSEVAGLKWNAIDFTNNTLAVRHTVTKFKTAVTKNRTKNSSSNRVLPLNQPIKEFLLRLRDRQSEEKQFFGQSYQNTEYVCRWPDGHALKCDYLSRAFKRVLLQNGLPENTRFHDLRHSCASYMLKTGCSMKEISDWLGHADIKTSMNIYAHLDTDARNEVANRLGSILLLE